MGDVMKPSSILVLLASLWLSSQAQSDDWPMWRYDELRSGDWEGTLADTLYPQWTRVLPPLEPAYHHPRLQFDAGYEPILVNNTLIFGSSVNHRVTALNAASGREVWRFYTEGPIRFAPVAFEDKVFVASDDGYIYCLKVNDGELIWKLQAVPSNRKLIGNRQLISVWPVRGGPVVADQTLYFAAGVWSFEGVFIYAVDANSGQIRWLNDSTGFLYGQHPHDAKAFGGLTPQGYLVVKDDELIIPCGSALPAILDRHSGRLKTFQLPKAGRSPGGWFTAAAKAKRRGQTVLDNEADDSREDRILLDSGVNRDLHENGWHDGPANTNARSQVTINGKVIDFNTGYPGVEGTVHTILVGDGRLFVVTREGGIYAFGPEQTAVQNYPLEYPTAQPIATDDPKKPEDAKLDPLDSLLSNLGVTHGYAVIAGIGDGKLIEQLATHSELQQIAIDPDSEKCHSMRLRLDQLGLLGTRVSVHQGHPLNIGLPPYCASLLIANDPESLNLQSNNPFFEQLYQLLRPFGGMAYLALTPSQLDYFSAKLESTQDVDETLAGAVLKIQNEWVVLTRSGPLKGATNYMGDWTSPDKRVKAPLGVLWFDDSVAHFKRAPQPLFVNGTMISYDKDWKGWPEGKRPPYPLLPPTYSDVYTGRVLSPNEVAVNVENLPTRDLLETQPTQYRHPSQTNAWSPAPPVIGERINPMTGETEPRGIPKSYGCDGGVDYQYLFTLRSGTAAFYDKRIDSGTIHISGPRSGCTNSIIPANGLLNVPYFYQGCTCSYPLPVGLALYSLPATHEQWAVWGPDKPASVRRLGINFGAPGARMSEAGTLWLEYPQVGGPAPEIQVTTVPESPQPFYRHSVWMKGGSGWPWVTASGLEGVSSVIVSGLCDEPLTVRLYFAEPQTPGSEVTPGPRLLNVKIQEKVVLERFDIAGEADGPMRGIVKEFLSIQSAGTLKIELEALSGSTVLCGLELIADGLPKDEFAAPEP